MTPSPAQESVSDAVIDETVDALEGMAYLIEQGDQDMIEEVAIDYLRDAVQRLRQGAATDVRTAGEGLTQEQREALNWAATTAQLQAGNMDGVFRPYETCAYMARISSTLRALASPPSNGDAK